MTDKVVRGQLLVFSSTPKDAANNVVSPATMKLYLNYFHADGSPTGTVSTDPPIDMDQQTDGSFRAEFDTKVAEPGAAFASIRAEGPAAADDIKFTIVANVANPDP
jgi:hypothetical protein